ncbi:MAG TPA: TetR/AcrR family transcriptional regulator [Thermoanaerobaculia bacterium]|nr:TetR/AcrR family transcriptional regulator [Thermoanaerobaculia bacterium]
MVKPHSQTGPATTPRDDGTEQRILDAAHTVFLARGTDGARMQEIADAAGVNKALLHYYYRTKDGLAQAVFERAAAMLMSDVLPIMASDLELEEKIEQFVAAELALLGGRPYLPGYVISELTHHPERLVAIFSRLAGNRVQKVVLPKLREQIRRRVDAGTLAPMSAEQFLVTCLACCVFPFAARPLLTVVLDLGARGFDRFIEQRKKELPEFLKRALQP